MLPVSVSTFMYSYRVGYLLPFHVGTMVKSYRYSKESIIYAECSAFHAVLCKW